MQIRMWVVCLVIMTRWLYLTVLLPIVRYLHMEFPKNFGRDCPWIIQSNTPIIQRGETTPIKIALINTGSGHSIPTNPWRKYTFVAEIVDAKEKVIWKSSELILGSNVKVVENPLIIEKSIEEVTADSNIKDEYKR